MKFLVDMGISPRTVEFLNSLEHESVHVQALGMQCSPDSEILDKALRENYIILTHDLDFGELLAASQGSLPSVIIFRLKNMSPSRVNNYLNRILSLYSENLKQGALISVRDKNIRIRRLPIN